MGVTRAVSETASKRRDALRKGYPTFDKGIVPQEDMRPSAVRKMLHADKSGEVGMMQPKAAPKGEVKMGGKGRIQRIEEPAPTPKKKRNMNLEA